MFFRLVTSVGHDCLPQGFWIGNEISHHRLPLDLSEPLSLIHQPSFPLIIQHTSRFKTAECKGCLNLAKIN